MKGLVARVEQQGTKHIILLTDWPAATAPTTFRLRRNSNLTPFLTPLGWKLAPQDLPIDAALADGKLTARLDRDLIRPIDQNELVTFVFPEFGLEAELPWPELILPARQSGARLAESPTPVDGPLTIQVEKPLAPAERLTLLSRPAPPEMGPVPVPVAKDVDAVRRSRSWLLWPIAAVLALTMAAGALWTDALPYVVMPKSERQFEGLQGGPFQPSSYDLIIIRQPWFEMLRGVFSSAPPQVHWESSHILLAQTLVAGLLLEVGPGADAAERPPGRYLVDLKLKDAFWGRSLATPRIELIVRERPPVPSINVSQNEIAFSGPQGGPFAPSSVSVTIAGQGAPGTWTLWGPFPEWLSVSQEGGDIQPGSETTTAMSTTVRAAALPAGTYETKLVFRDAGGQAHTRTARLTVQPPPPSITVSQAELVFRGPQGGPFIPAQASATLTGQGSLGAWTLVSIPPEWLWISQSSGDIAPSQKIELAIATTARASALSVGNYEAPLLFRDASGQVHSRAVRLEILPRPTITLTQEEIAFSGPSGGPFTPSAGRVLIAGQGSTGNWELSGTLPEWLEASPSGGSIAPGQAVNVTVALTTRAQSLRAGNYEAPLTFRDGSGQAYSRTVRLQVQQKPPASIIVSQNEIVFFGPRGGPFTPSNLRVNVTGQGSPGTWSLSSSMPEWLSSSQSGGNIQPQQEVGVLLATTARAASLEPGSYTGSLLFRDDTGQVQTRTARLLVRQPPPPPIRHDVVCDEAASFRYDTDRVAGRDFMNDPSTMTDQQIDDGIRSCTTTIAAGANRRFDLQIGRLLAERAVRRARQGFSRDAEADMNQALQMWRSAAGKGSAYALNMLGVYYNGTFNRSANFSFVTPDQYQTTDYWRLSASSGNVVGAHNFAVQQLHGSGTERNIAQALSGLERSAAAGYALSSFVLGEAIYFGYPAGVPKNTERGLHLMRSVACSERAAMNVLDKLVRDGRISESDRPRC